MRPFLYSLLAYSSCVSSAFAADEGAGVFSNSSVSENDLKTGNITFDKIPGMIVSVTSFILEISSVVAFVVILIGALRWVLAGVGALGG